MMCCKCCKGQEETLKSYGGAAAHRANQPGTDIGFVCEGERARESDCALVCA